MITKDNVAVFAQKIAKWIAEQTCGKGVVLGMSGGIDCSVVAVLCKLANVEVLSVFMPYDNNSAENAKSHEHVLELLDKFDLSYHCFDIKPAVDALSIYSRSSTTEKEDLSIANIRPRVRMTYLYHRAQKMGRLVIGTSNLAERTLGYFTKWGDGACDINPIGMLTKQEVYTLAEYLEVPENIIRKKPSAELWEGQTDEEHLGLTYTQIDTYILEKTSGDKEIDKKIEGLIRQTAHKRNPIPMFEFS
jgi:NAD+ synthase